MTADRNQSRRQMRSPWSSLLAALVAINLIGCRESGPADNDQSRDESGAEVRERFQIVSLSPAISRSLVDFGFEEFVIGRTPWCTSLDDSIPIAGDLMEIDYERLIELDPTHVLVQPPAAGVDPELIRLAEDMRWELHSWRLDSIKDIRTLARELPSALGADAASGPVIDAIDRALQPSTAVEAAGRTLLVFSVHPVTVFGRGTYFDETWIALGGENAVDLTGYPELSLEDVVDLNPETIVLVYDARPESDDAHRMAGALADADIAAARNGRIAMLVHRDALMPSTGITDVAKQLKRVMSDLIGAHGGPNIETED